jgi:hypothetical protein
LRFERQNLELVEASLSEMTAEWQDATSLRVIEKIRAIPAKLLYQEADLARLFDVDFTDAITISRLFLGLSRDAFEMRLIEQLPGGSGANRYRSEPEAFISALVGLGVLDAMTEVVNAPTTWSDILVERLRSGRGRAISGMARGRSLEDFVEEIVKDVFGHYDVRCSFRGKDQIEVAKADFAIPAKSDPRIVIEAKGYAATGSKQTDVLGDLKQIIRAKRGDTVLLFVTDGLTWRRRKNDLRKIVALQNEGDVSKIYTRAMANDLTKDLIRLRGEFDLEQ